MAQNSAFPKNDYDPFNNPTTATEVTTHCKEGEKYLSINIFRKHHLLLGNLINNHQYLDGSY
jgi:hypothetical protein